MEHYQILFSSHETPCVACGEAAEKPRNKELFAGFAVRSCRRCGFVVGEFQPRESLTQYGHVNMENYMGSLGVMRKEEAASHVAMAMRSRPELYRWLDVGCGIARVLVEAKSHGFAVLGVEPDPIARSIASDATGASILDDFNDKTVPDNSQGVISMLDFLEHIRPCDLEDIARRVRKKLTPGGLWLIKVPSTDGLFYKTAKSAAALAPSLVTDVIKRLWMLEYEFPHRVYFNERSLRAFLKRSGFSVDSVRYTPAMPNGTILKRLRMNETLSSGKVVVLAPMAFIINLIEKVRKHTDSLVILARRDDTACGVR